MSDTDIRTIHWIESPYDLQQISNNNWQFQIAKKVTASTGGATSNIIWQSRGLQPTATVSWHVHYALNWAATLPSTGVTVTIGGNWQACNKGDIYDLNNLGEWVPSQNTGKAGWLGVGNILYKYPDPSVPGIHIIVGVKNAATGLYDAIFIDPTSLPLNSSASYQPQEDVIWWLEESNLTGSVYSQSQGSIGSVDLSNPAPSTDKFEWWTTYLFSTGSWANSQTAPQNSYTAPLPSEVSPLTSGAPDVEVFPWPWAGVVALGAAVAAARQNVVKADLTVQLRKKYSVVAVDFESTSGLKLKFTLSKSSSAPRGSLEALGYTAGDDPKGDVSSALALEVQSGGFPTGETFTWMSS